MLNRWFAVATYLDELPDTLEREVSLIHPACEKAIELNHPNPLFRSSITDAVGRCYREHQSSMRLDPGAQTFSWRVPAEAVSPSKWNDTVILTLPVPELLWAVETVCPKRRKQELAPFENLIKGLARAFCCATGSRPTVSFDNGRERGYGLFWKLVEIVLPAVRALTAGTGKPFRQPASKSALAKKIKRILDGEDMVQLIEYEVKKSKGELPDLP